MGQLDSTATVPTQHLVGLIEKVTFHNPENGFCVLRVRTEGRQRLDTVVGHAVMISAGEWIRAAGGWTVNPTYGAQFKAMSIEASPPTGSDGIRRYLASGMIRGIGTRQADRLLAAFGTDVLEVIENEPQRLRAVPGIGAQRAASIRAAWAEQKSLRELMMFLYEHGIGTARAVRLHQTYGSEAVGIISADPYRLAREIRSIGFKTADAIADSLGLEKTSMTRVRAGVAHVLDEAIDQGHCGLPVDELHTRAVELLEVPAETVDEAVALELIDRRVVIATVEERHCVFPTDLDRAERTIADRLLRLAAGRPPWPAVDAASAVPWVEGVVGTALSDSQRRALRLALSSKVLVITGGPGVGKTTLVNSILRILLIANVKIALAAPTGRAAKRLGEVTGLEAKTIHRLLAIRAGEDAFRHNENRPLDCDLLVVDEASMVDVPLMRSLLRAVPDTAALILVGDVDQLPSVGPGQVLADIIGGGAVPVVRLSEVFRQAARSRIVTTAHAINRGELPDVGNASDGDLRIVTFDDPEGGAEALFDLVTRRIPDEFGLDPVRDIQVLCPMNRGLLGARSLNLDLQQALNPAASEEAIERFGWRFAPGDKVMQTSNDYDKDVFNGDLGLITWLDHPAGELAVAFDGREVCYRFGELDGIVPAYATTIHKAQGSEYPAVVIPLTTQHYPMLARNLLYTGVTRGRRLVVLVAQPKALAIAVRGGYRQGRRWSQLRKLIEAGANC